ncbi:hypothetical protein [Frigoriglobus tundricola]|uniref:Uncharacterized protein n=1 Tax=Frigoriglobus tundricola TaxID=2774151 RepID=A0A6M5Z5X6_9BACT|nr:hypothetical protein [Frigoriglobus tundricola]QJX01095.1 hypothetical protein FTUN_8734 [Frigoriglobus tundricola]
MTRRPRNQFKRRLAPHQTDVPAELRVGTCPVRAYPKKCYIKALEYFLAHVADDVVLCHGEVAVAEWGLPFPHAWVELPGGIVFDGVAQMFCDRDGYQLTLGVAPERVRRYTPDEVNRLILESEHAGPWDADRQS